MTGFLILQKFIVLNQYTCRYREEYPRTLMFSRKAGIILLVNYPCLYKNISHAFVCLWTLDSTPTARIACQSVKGTSSWGDMTSYSEVGSLYRPI